jgi:lysophospholipase L1-like esterase
MKILIGLLITILVITSGQQLIGQSDLGNLNVDKINISGCNYIKRKDGAISFQRFSDEMLAMPVNKSRFNSKKAKTNTGVTISFRTNSPKTTIIFKYNSEGDNRGATFGIHKNSELTGKVSFRKTDGPNLKVVINEDAVMNNNFYEITLPNWANVILKDIELEKGYTLLPNPEPNKKIYVSYGNSITHGTGQNASYQTYPFILSQNMGWELFNVAVGGGKTSPLVAEMLRDDFGKIDYMTILIGYNDYNGEGIDTKEYSKRYEEFLSIIREKHKTTKIFCITPTYTTNHTSAKSGIPISDFRKVVIGLVEKYSKKGDKNIYLIEGEKISTEKDLKDPVHFSIEGAGEFAKQLTEEMKLKLDLKYNK